MDVVAEQQREAEERWRAGFLTGPNRTRHETLPPQVGDPAPDMELPDSTGTVRRLSEFWHRGPAVVIFLRHFGCSCLAERCETLQHDIPEFERAGAQVLAVGQGKVERTAAIAARRGYRMTLLCDPDLVAYRAYGLLQGTAPALLHDFPFEPGDDATAAKWLDSRRGTERALVDDPWQLPGEFVIAPGGTIAHVHRYQYCEDFPPKTVLLGAIAAARG